MMYADTASGSALGSQGPALRAAIPVVRSAGGYREAVRRAAGLSHPINSRKATGRGSGTPYIPGVRVSRAGECPAKQGRTALANGPLAAATPGAKA